MFGVMVLVIYKSTISVMGNFGGGKMMGMKKSNFKVNIYLCDYLCIGIWFG
jgi:hypothetical protein